MEKADVERLVRVEVGVNSLVESFKAHIEADCDKLGCVLHDDVLSLKQTQKSARKITWTGVVVGVGVGLRYLLKGISNV